MVMIFPKSPCPSVSISPSLIVFHPQRWTNIPFLWVKELVVQNVKNEVKKLMVRYQLT
jgi:hypothetical protein